MTLEELTDARLIIIASVVNVEETPLSVIIVHSGKEIVDEVILTTTDVETTLQKIYELMLIYSPYTKGLCELQTDIKELIKLTASISGLHVRPKRRQEIEVFSRRALESYMRDEIFSEEPNEPETETEPQKKRSKLREWLINVLQSALNKLQQGERDNETTTNVRLSK